MSTAPRWASLLTVLGASFALGCAGEELPGNYFDVALKGADNSCTGGGATYSDRLTYRVVFSGNNVSVAIEDDVWATGIVDGCRLDYTSLLWATVRDGAEIQWKITGTARVDAEGGMTCLEEPATDWVGTETFIVTGSAHPDVSPGCTYTVDTGGEFLEKLGE